jgi:leucyl-tRNA synthetase
MRHTCLWKTCCSLSHRRRALLLSRDVVVLSYPVQHSQFPCKQTQCNSPVQEAKPLIRQQLLDAGKAVVYCEPEGQVISRSGDECVVTLAAQWYLDYGEEGWKQQALTCLSRMNTYFPEARNAFEKNLDWLRQWACSRSFGLGSRLPWDKAWLIESLSDSTIYMAYYTVAHYLQANLEGSEQGLAGIPAEAMTDAVWDHIFLGTPIPADLHPALAPEKLAAMRREFNYFYPLDLRCSGKDLITNHLTFFLYNHVALFPEDKWPLAIRPNGHLLINNAKMSKSTGNFMTLTQALEVFGADATRFALADAGDGVDDANFLAKTADDAILKLHTEKEWTEEVLAARGTLRTGPLSWNDHVFLAEMSKCVAEAQVAYENMLYRNALKSAFFDMQNVRAEYRKVTTGVGMAHTSIGPDGVMVDQAGDRFEGMHIDVLLKFIAVQAIMVSPIVPHWSEWVWREALGNTTTSIHTALWPELPTTPEGAAYLEASQYIRRLCWNIRSGEDQASRKRAKKGIAAGMEDMSVGSRTLRLYVAADFPDWQIATVQVAKACFDKVCCVVFVCLMLSEQQGMRLRK